MNMTAPSVGIGQVWRFAYSDLVAVVVAAWADEDGEDVRIVPLSTAPEGRQHPTDRDVVLTPDETSGGEWAVAHAWLSRTVPREALSHVVGSVSTEALHAIRSAELVGIDPDASKAFESWRGGALSGEDDPRIAEMRRLLEEWDDAERYQVLFRSVEWQTVQRSDVSARSVLGGAVRMEPLELEPEGKLALDEDRLAQAA